MPSIGKSLLGASLPQVKDCALDQERARGNMPLARLDAKPQDRDMTQEQWCVFAGLRAFPCLQIRSLSVALAQDTLVLNTPEVCNVAFQAPVCELIGFIHMFFPRQEDPVSNSGDMNPGAYRLGNLNNPLLCGRVLGLVRLLGLMASPYVAS